MNCGQAGVPMLLLRSVPSVAQMPSHGSVFVPIVLLPSFVALHVYIPGLWAPLSSTESHPSVYCKALASAFPKRLVPLQLTVTDTGSQNGLRSQGPQKYCA
jgi:hypothetical protein